MKKLSLMLALLALLLLGCQKEQSEAVNNPSGAQNEQNDSTLPPENGSANAEKPGGQTEAPNSQTQNDNRNSDKPAAPEPTDKGSGFRADLLKPEDLKKGIFSGLEFHHGSKFSDITARWGKPTEEGYLRGGKYAMYSKEDYDVYFFDPETGSTVTHIQLNPKVKVTLDDIRKQLGKPDADELDEMMSETWTLFYNYETFVLYVVGKDESKNSEVEYLFLKHEQ